MRRREAGIVVWWPGGSNSAVVLGPQKHELPPGPLINHLFALPLCIPVGLQGFIFLFAVSSVEQNTVFSQCLREK